MRVGVGIIFFDDAKGLQRCLNSIASHVDLIIAIDGRFKEFEECYDVSRDGSKEVVESYSNARYYCFPNLTEIEKRNKYLELANSYGLDFLLVLDSDEYVKIDYPLFRSNLEAIFFKNECLGKSSSPEVYAVKMYDRQFEKPHNVIERHNERLLYKPGCLRYSSIHSNLVDINDASRNFTTAKYTAEIEGITLYNDDSLRSTEYVLKSIKYQRYLFGSERLERKRIVGYETLKYK
ncbi:hypothetical protein [Candidatus Nitrosocosmicus franklandus]|nr:hypothetical protein [Candidatus Nitrosocosmicus franklandus]